MSRIDMYAVFLIYYMYTITYHCACRFKIILEKSLTILYITQYSSHAHMTLFMSAGANVGREVML